MNFFAIASLSCGIFCAVLFFITLIFGKTKLHKLLLYFNLSVAVWGFGCFIAGMAKDSNAALLGWRFAHIGGIFVSIFFYHFVCQLLSLQRKWPLIFSYAWGIVFLFLTIFTDSVFNRTRFVFDSLYYNHATELFYLLAFLWFASVIAAFYELIKIYSKTDGIRRSQISYVIFGFLTGFLGGTSTFLPEFQIDLLYPFGNFGIAIYSVIVTYAILKYRLMDIKIAITRFGIFVLVYTLVLGLPFVIALAYKNLFQDLLADSWWIIPMVTMALFATAGPYVYLFFQKKAEDRLLATQKQYQQTLIQASLGMNRIKELSRLLNLIVHIVTKTVRIEHSGIYLLDAETNLYMLKASRLEKKRIVREKIDSEEPLIRYMEKIEAPLIYAEIKQKAEDSSDDGLKKVSLLMKEMQSEMIVPNIVNKKMVGFISLGKKKSGKMYTEEDIAVFSILANQSALAIENAIFYEESGKDLAQRFHESRLRGLGQLSSGVAHQIHNRLNIISLGGAVLIDMLKDITPETSREEIDQLIEKTKKDIEKMVNSAIRGEEIANAIKNYAHANPKPQVIILDEILQSSMALVTSKHPDFKYSLLKDYKTSSPIWANYSTMQDVIFNNIDNSCDAMKLKKRQIAEGHLSVENYMPEIKITTFDAESHIKIEIEDNGIGMTKDQLEKMFVPFYTTKGAQKGTGMGMNVAYQLLSANKGTIAIDSVYQSWTKVTIVIPKATQEQIQADKNKEQENGHTEDSIG